MKYFLISICSIIIFVSNVFFANPLNAQGFDWQWSARMPFENPNLYWGIDAKFGLQSANGAISFVENEVPCQDFKDAAGNKYSLGINLEYWERQNRYAFRASLHYGFNKISSKSQEEHFYRNPDLESQTPIIGNFEKELNLNFSQIDLKVGGKYRILNTHLNVGLNLVLSIFISKSYDVKERILGPPEIPPFANTNSYERVITQGEINTFSTILFNPEFNIGYDFQLGLGTYFEPNISISLPINSMFSSDNVKNYITSFGIKFYRKF